MELMILINRRPKWNESKKVQAAEATRTYLGGVL